MEGRCPCGGYHSHQCCPYYSTYDSSSSSSENYFYSSYSSSPPVDCTLSLGTPATRRNDAGESRSARKSTSGWNFFRSDRSSSSHCDDSKKSSSHRGGGGGSDAGNILLPRRCANCDTTSTPLWRNGPRGPKSLCNACGIRYKKEERRASAAAAANSAFGGGGGGGGMQDSHTAAGYYNGSWSHQAPMQYFSPPATTEYGWLHG